MYGNGGVWGELETCQHAIYNDLQAAVALSLPLIGVTGRPRTTVQTALRRQGPTHNATETSKQHLPPEPN